MSLCLALELDLPNMYSALADAKVTYNGSDINVFYEDNYEIQNITDKSIKVQTKDVPALTDGEVIVLNGVSYEVINFEKTVDGLETIIALSEV